MPRDESVLRTQELMKEAGFGALLLYPGVNMFAVTGLMKESYERLLTVIIPAKGKPVALAPTFEIGAVEGGVRVDVEVRGWNDEENPYERVSGILKEMKLDRSVIGIDGKMQYVFAHAIANSVPNAKFKDATGLLAKLRLVKTKEQVDLIRKAAQIACRAINVAFESVSPGMSELEVKDILAAEAEKQGGTVEGNVSSGPGTIIPHWQTSERKVQKGELLLIDIGLVYKRCYGDITRTAVLGKPTPKLKRIYGIVKRAHFAACAADRAGIEAQDLDRAARSEIVRAGFGDYFTHRVGHGLGLEIHEPPFLVEGNTQKLEPGMVHTIEPGIYLPNEFGVRIENDLLVTPDGSENLSEASSPSEELLSL